MTIHANLWADELERHAPPVASPTINLAKFLHDKITLAAHDLAPGTVLRYRNMIDWYIRPPDATKAQPADRHDWPLAGLALNRIGATDGAAFQRKLLDRGLSARTVAGVMRLIRSGLADAAQQRIIRGNPWDNLPMVKARAVHRDAPPAIRAFGALRQHLAQPQPDETPGDAFLRQRLGMLFALAADTGARRSELLACCWRHMDFEAGRLTIEGSLDGSDPSALTVKAPKTVAGRRRVTLSPEMVAQLRTWRAHLGKAGLAAGRDLRFSPILPGDIQGGSWWQPNSCSQAARRAMARVGLKGSLHTVRHANATALMSTAGIVPATVAKRLGHSSPKITLTLYAHAMPEQDEVAAAVIAAALRGVV